MELTIGRSVSRGRSVVTLHRTSLVTTHLDDEVALQIRCWIARPSTERLLDGEDPRSLGWRLTHSTLCSLRSPPATTQLSGSTSKAEPASPRSRCVCWVPTATAFDASLEDPLAVIN